MVGKLCDVRRRRNPRVAAERVVHSGRRAWGTACAESFIAGPLQEYWIAQSQSIATVAPAVAMSTSRAPPVQSLDRQTSTRTSAANVIRSARDLPLSGRMWIEFFGLICCGWTLYEVSRLVTRGLRRERYTKASADTFGAWDGRGEAIDVEIVD